MHKLSIIALLLPLIGLSAFLFKIDLDYRKGVSWEVKITGTDPRHILKGHYVTYRTMWNFDMNKVLNYVKKNAKFSYYQVPTCLCLIGNQSKHLSYPVLCKEENRLCKSIIKGHFSISKKRIFSKESKTNDQEKQNFQWAWNEKSVRFKTGINKFFVDESMAKKLEKEIRKRSASIVFKISSPTQIISEELKLDGKNWLKVLSEQEK